MSDRLSQLDVEHRTVIVRCDLNVPLDASGEVVAIADDGRIRASIPTLTALRNRGAKVVVLAHLGRPKGQPDPGLSLEPVARRLGELLAAPVTFIDAVSGPTVDAAVRALQRNRNLARCFNIYSNDKYDTIH